MGDDGVVRIDGELCIACGACARNCPFDAITVLREEGFSIKCDLCETRVGGRGPACVEVCPVVAVRLIERE
jgi:Fe-S-cluster-containing hydrogenase component 2